MSGATMRIADASDRAAIRAVEERAFGQAGEADLVERLVADGDAVLEYVAEIGGIIVGHVLFSRLHVEAADGARFPAVALAPLAVLPEHRREGIGAALIRAAHSELIGRQERLSVVLGEPAYYSRFGYEHARVEGFDSEYQCEALQALAWGDAPLTGRLVYAPAFAAL